MSALTLTLKRRLHVRVDMSPLVPNRLAGLGASEIAAIPLVCGNTEIDTGEIFRIEGTDPGVLRILRSTDRLDAIGAELADGSIEIRGRTGDWLGRGMRGGNIRVQGHAGTWTGAGMRGGTIVVNGDVGDFLGAPLPGNLEGMDDATIHVYGNAGDRVGDRQRRGLIVIEGNAGDFCGSRMLAGTIMVLGTAGRCVGTGMRRGTIVLRRRPKSIGATFNNCGVLKMEVLRLLFRQVRSENRRLADLEALGPLAQRYAGDLAHGGKGEILVLQGP
ncbi:MAG: formylmethanofuran dehydrogenase subunit C [Gammaproteobacteria bacterium]|nr:formylmethanofuran dehydrogenase subunit C [Gammaproteobacteria bacterium]